MDAKPQNARLSVELDPSWTEDPALDCYECGRSVRIEDAILIPGSKYGDPEGDEPDCILAIHREKCW